jgi:gamma-glutamyltranspeptidase / glutathione hydrolase
LSEEARTGWWDALRAWLPPGFEQPPAATVRGEAGVVVAYHPRVREIGQRILAAGGNAADAFVAAVVATNVVGEGASSLAGPLGAMVHRAWPAVGPSTSWLDAEFDQPLDEGQAQPGRSRPFGRAVLVPGAPLGLSELARRHATLPMATLVEPAAELAEHGFPVTNLLAGLIRWRRRVLGRSEYGRRTFFLDGQPLAAGQTLRQPELAGLLRRWAVEGPALWYRGEWAGRFLEAVGEHGGRLGAADLERYRVHWRQPWAIRYRGRTVLAAPAPSFGGYWVLLALRVWEQLAEDTGAAGDHAAASEAARLERMIRTAHHVWSEPDLLRPEALADTERIRGRVASANAAVLAERVRRRERARPMSSAASHSYHVITMDRAGNLVSGTTTIQSAPWGEGIFVDGVPVNAAGSIPWAAQPGQRRLTALTSQLVLDAGGPRHAVGTISNSLLEAAFQILVELLDNGSPVHRAVSAPRFGTFPPRRWLLRGMPMLDRNWLDPRLDRSVVRELRRTGLRVVQSGTVDTGLGAVLSVHGDAAVGMTLPLPHVERPFDEAGAVDGREVGSAPENGRDADLWMGPPRV